MCTPGEDIHSHFLLGTSPFPVRMCIPSEPHPHSRWECAFPVRHIPITGENAYSIVIHSHRKWGCALPEMYIITWNGDVPHQECTSSPEMGM